MTVENRDEPHVEEPPLMEAILAASNLLPHTKQNLSSMEEVDIAAEMQRLTKLVLKVHWHTIRNLDITLEHKKAQRRALST